MSRLMLSLKQPPRARVDMSPLTPEKQSKCRWRPTRLLFAEWPTILPKGTARGNLYPSSR